MLSSNISWEFYKWNKNTFNKLQNKDNQEQWKKNVYPYNIFLNERIEVKIQEANLAEVTNIYS